MTYLIRIRNIVAPGRPTPLFMGSARDALAWVQSHKQRSDEDLYAEVKETRNGLAGWWPLRGKLADYAKREETAT